MSFEQITRWTLHFGWEIFENTTGKLLRSITRPCTIFESRRFSNRQRTNLWYRLFNGNDCQDAVDTSSYGPAEAEAAAAAATPRG